MLAVARVVNQLDDCEFGVVAVAVAEPYDSRVAARTVTVALAEFVEQTLQRGDSGGARRATLIAAARRGGLRAVARVEERGGLSAQVERLRRGRAR